METHSNDGESEKLLDASSSSTSLDRAYQARPLHTRKARWNLLTPILAALLLLSNALWLLSVIIPGSLWSQASYEQKTYCMANAALSAQSANESGQMAPLQWWTYLSITTGLACWTGSKSPMPLATRRWSGPRFFQVSRLWLTNYHLSC